MAGVAGGIVRAVNGGMNAAVMPLLRSTRFHRVASRNLALVTYTGRQSGREFTTPVIYTRDADHVRIRVAMADAKQWWRNFEVPGAPIRLLLAGTDHRGHGVASRDSRDRTWVDVDLAS